MASQPEIEAEINKLLQQRTALIRENAAAMSQQVQLAVNLCDAMNCENIDQVRESTANLNEELARNSERVTETEQGVKNLNQEMKKSKKMSGTMKGALVGAFVGIKNAATTATAGIGSFFSSITSLGTSIFNIGKSVMKAWGAMTGFLIQKAHEGGQANLAIQNAWEDVREEFGSFETEASGSVKQAMVNLTQGAEGLAAGGLSVASTFGKGRDGVAASIKDVLEVAKALGPEFHALGNEFSNIIEEAYRLTKGAGLSAEALTQMSRNARSSGESFEDALKETERMSAFMQKKFGISAKAVGKNFSEMAANVEIFGSMTREQMMGAAAWATKLGIEVKALQGITSKTDDFEGAADAVSKLSEAFGMQLDTMELMTADPAEKAEMIRESFAATGKDFSTMSRQQKAYMAELSGMDVGSLQSLFDPNAMGMDDFMGAAKDGKEGAITQAEATKLLSKNIKQLHETMGGMSGKEGFLGTFFEGMSKGFTKSKMFRELLRDVRQAMRKVFKTGKEVGKMLAELFDDGGPFAGIRAIFQDYFSPAKWDARMKGVKAAFRGFVDMMKTDPKKAFGQLLTDLKAVFFDGGGGEFFKILKAGLVTAIDNLGAAFIGAIPTLLQFMIDGLMALGQMLGGDASKFGKSLGEGVMFPAILDAWNSVKDNIGPMLGTIWDLFSSLITTFWEKYGDKVVKLFGGILAGFIGKAVLVAIAGAGIGAIVGKALGPIMDGIKSFLGMGGDASAIENVAANVTKGVAAGVNEMESLSLAGLAKAGLVAAAMTYFIIEAAVPLAKAVVAAAKVFMAGGVSFEAVGMAIASLVGVTFALKQIVEASSNLAAGDIMKTGVVMGALVFIVPHIADLGIEIAQKIAGAGLGSLNWMDVLKFFAVLAPLIWTSVKMVEAASNLNPGSVTKAAAGLLAMVLLIPHLSDLGVKISKDIMGLGLENLAWQDMAKFFVGLEGMVLTSVGMVYAASTLNPASLATAALGLAAMVLLIPHLADLGVEIVDKLHKILPKLNAIGFDALGKFMLAIAGMAAIAAGLVIASVAVAASLNPVTALIAVAALTAMVLMVPKLADLGTDLVKRLSKIPTNIVEKGGRAGIVIAEVAASMAVAFVALLGVGLMALVGGGAGATKGVNALTKMAKQIVEKLFPVVKKIETQIKGNPDTIKKKVDLFLDVIKALYPFADLANSLAQVKGNAQKVGTLADKVTKVIDGMMDGAKKLLDALVMHVKEFSEEDMSKAASIGGLLSSLSNLMKNIAPEMDKFATTIETTSAHTNPDAWIQDETIRETSKTTIGADLGQWSDAIVKIMGQLGLSIDSVVEAVQKLPSISSGDPLLEKLETAAKVSEIASNMAQLVGSVIAVKDVGNFRQMIYRLGALFYETGIPADQDDIYDFMVRMGKTTWPKKFMSNGFSESLRGLEGPASAVRTAMRKGGPVEDMYDSGKYWRKISSASFREKMDTIGRIMDTLKESLPGVAKSFSFKSAWDLSKDAYKWINKFIDPMNDVLNRMKVFNNKFKDDFATNIVATMEEIIIAWNELGETLYHSNHIYDAVLNLEKFATTLGVDKPDIKISKGDVNVNLDIKVVMQADDVATVLIDQKMVKAGDAWPL